MEPPEVTKVPQTEIVKSHFDEIEQALERGIPIEQVHKVMADLGLSIHLTTFKGTLNRVRKEIEVERIAQEKAERRAKREAKQQAKAQSNGVRRYPKVDPSKVTLPPRTVKAEIVEDWTLDKIEAQKR